MFQPVQSAVEHQRPLPVLGQHQRVFSLQVIDHSSSADEHIHIIKEAYSEASPDGVLAVNEFVTADVPKRHQTHPVPGSVENELVLEGGVVAFA